MRRLSRLAVGAVLAVLVASVPQVAAAEDSGIDVPWNVIASPQINAVSLRWYAPSYASSTHGEYAGYEVLAVDANGVPGAVVATDQPQNYNRTVLRSRINGLTVGQSYSFAVRAVLPDGSHGALSSPVSATPVPRVLAYVNETTVDNIRGLTTRGIDPITEAAIRYQDEEQEDHLAVSPDQRWLATSSSTAGANACTVALLSVTSLDPPVRVPHAELACDSSPSFADNGTVIFSRIDDKTADTFHPYLVSYSMSTGQFQRLVGGDGLTQPAAARDGSIVAVSTAAQSLVRLRPGDPTGPVPIPGTTDGTQPAVSGNGDIAFVDCSSGYPLELVAMASDGSQRRSLVQRSSGVVRGPSWTRDGSTVYFTIDYDIWRAAPTTGSLERLTDQSVEQVAPISPVLVEAPDPVLQSVVTVSSPAYTSASSFVATVSGASDVVDAEVQSGPVGGTLSAFSSPAGWTASSSRSFTVLGSDGYRYCVRARGRAPDGAPGDWSQPACTMVDRTAPSMVKLSTPPAYNVSTHLGITMAYKDTASGFSSYTVRHRHAATSGNLSGYATTHPFTSGSYSITAADGYEYCFQVRATDKAGNTSPWSPERCTRTALDDRSLTASGSVSRISSTYFHKGTASRLNAVGAQLASGRVSGVRVGLVMRTCSTCGQVAVYVGSTRVATVSTSSSVTRDQAVLWLPRFSATRTGTLVLRSTSRSQVVVDGVLVQHL